MVKLEEKVKKVLALNKISLMGHIICGYPDFSKSFDAAMGIGSVADFLEVQFPFSDPTADGPVIEQACYKALDKGFKTAEGFDFVKKLTQKTTSSIVIMTYANIAFRFGIEKFVKEAAVSGADGLIIPDLPFEADEGLLKIAESEKIGVILIAAPGADENRIRNLSDLSCALLYVTARRGITGTTTTIDEEVYDWINFVKKYSTKPIALGFGIKNSQQVKELKGRVPIVVAGSYFVEKISKLKAIDDYALELSEAAKALII